MLLKISLNNLSDCLELTVSGRFNHFIDVDSVHLFLESYYQRTAFPVSLFALFGQCQMPLVVVLMLLYIMSGV